jgi:hypothetical protein
MFLVTSDIQIDLWLTDLRLSLYWVAYRCKSILVLLREVCFVLHTE